MARKKSKERLKSQKDFRRLEKKRAKPHIVISCEGEKTEFLYLRDLKNKKKLHSTHILEVVTGAEVGTHPRNLVEGAIAKRKELNKKGIRIERTFSVFDRNSHYNIHEAFDLARGNNVEVVFSNPCFELWYLLHFGECNAWIERDNARRDLKRKDGLNDYHKSKEGVYGIIHDKQRDAIIRARRVREIHLEDIKLWDSNPYTDVDILVEYLNSLSK